MSNPDDMNLASRSELYDRAMKAFVGEDYLAALEFFEAYLNEATDSASTKLARLYVSECHSRHGFQHLHRGNFGTALRHLKVASDLHPSYPDLRLGLAKAQRGLRNFAGSDEQLEKCLSLNPKFVQAIWFKGVCYYEDGQHLLAMDQFFTAISLDPSLNNDRFQQCLQYHNEGALRLALSMLRTTDVAASDSAEQRAQRGDSYAVTGDTTAALREYEAAVNLRPGFADYRLKLGRLLIAESRLADAADQLTIALRINPNYLEVLCTLAEVHVLQGSLAQAQEFYSRALEMDPTSITAQAGLRSLAA